MGGCENREWLGGRKFLLSFPLFLLLARHYTKNKRLCRAKKKEKRVEKKGNGGHLMAPAISGNLRWQDLTFPHHQPQTKKKCWWWGGKVSAMRDPVTKELILCGGFLNQSWIHISWLMRSHRVIFFSFFSHGQTIKWWHFVFDCGQVWPWKKRKERKYKFLSVYALFLYARARTSKYLDSLFFLSIVRPVHKK